MMKKKIKSKNKDKSKKLFKSIEFKAKNIMKPKFKKVFVRNDYLFLVK